MDIRFCNLSSSNCRTMSLQWRFNETAASFDMASHSTYIIVKWAEINCNPDRNPAICCMNIRRLRSSNEWINIELHRSILAVSGPGFVFTFKFAMHWVWQMLKLGQIPKYVDGIEFPWRIQHLFYVNNWKQRGKCYISSPYFRHEYCFCHENYKIITGN